MLKILIGVKGTGKTKTLIELVNSAAEKSEGSVICIESGDKLRYELTYKARLVNVAEYCVSDAKTLYGFVSGIVASNHDITHIYIDSALNICKKDVVAFDSFVSGVADLCEKNDIEVVMTVSLPTEEASETVKKYI